MLCAIVGACTPDAPVQGPPGEGGSQAAAATPAADDDHASTVAAALPASAEPAPPPGESAPGAPAPFADFPIPTNCQAPLSWTEEIARLVTRAAAHATRSKACVDGSGRRVAATDLLVCPGGPDGTAQKVKVFYRMAVYPEGDTRACGRYVECDWLTPTVTEHLVELRLQSAGKGTLVLDVPKTLPGMDADATPLDQVHDGDCYGNSPPFAARVIAAK